jgi:hypothetical protein
MTLKSSDCSCANNEIVKTFLYTEKAEQQTIINMCKKEINIALNWLDKAVKSLTICKK